MTDLDTTGARLGRTSAVTGTGTRTRASTVTSVTRTRSGVVGEGVFRGRRLVQVIGAGLRSGATWVGGTLTMAGWLIVGVLAAGLVAGLLAGWTVGWMLAGASAALLVGCIPFLFGGHDYRVELVLDRERVVAGTEVTGRLEVRNASAHPSLPGSVDIPVGDGLVQVDVPFLLAGHTHVEAITIAARRRVVIDVGPLSVSRGDPVGILRREVVWPDIQTVHVHPATAPIPSTSAGLIRDLEGLPTSTIVASDLAFHAIREYAAGDSPRHIHWKSTAKTGQLMVRQYEETRQSRIAVLLGTAADEPGAAESEYASDEEFELAVAVAASLGVQAVRDGREVFITTTAERPLVSRGDVVAVRSIPTRTLTTMLDGFAEITRAERVSRLEDVAALTAQAGPEMSLVFLVTGGGMSLERCRAALLPFGPDAAGVVVRCIADADPIVRRAGRLRVLTVGALGDLGQLLVRGALE